MQRMRLRGRIDVRQLTALLLALAGLGIGVWSWTGYAVLTRTEHLVISATRIAPGQRLDAAALRVIDVPTLRPPALTGAASVEGLVGQYARVELLPDTIVRAAMVQPTPLDAHVFSNGELPAETLQQTVFELGRSGLSSVNANDQLNVLALLPEVQGADGGLSVGWMDAPGSGSRVVRVLRGLNVLHVTEDLVLLDVTPAQHQYLWSLVTRDVRLVGELATADVAPLGPLRPGDATAVLLDNTVVESFARGRQ